MQSTNVAITKLSPSEGRHESGFMMGADHAPIRAPTLSPSIVAFRISDFVIRTEAERLHLFRLFLQTTVRRVSPLLIDLAALDGILLSEVLAFVRPPQNWPWRPLYDSSPSLMRHSLRRKVWLRAVGSRDAWHFERTFANPAVIIRKVDHPSGRFAIRPCGSMLGFTAAIGPCLLSSFGSTAILKFPNPIAEILLASLVGRKLDEVIEHPIFMGRNYVIRRAIADPSDALPVLTFSAKLVPFAWPKTPQAGD